MRQRIPVTSKQAQDVHAEEQDPVEALARARLAILEQVSKVIVGQEEVIEDLLIGLFAQGHCLFIGVPGLGKTLLVQTVSRALALEFSRVQFTPDLMPSDITGTDILDTDPETGERCYRFVSGPIFTNVLLADEINRAPPKTQSALLQAMQEREVTAGGRTYPLAEPFFVLATQNPIEQEGTYPLPEAQLDRFLLSVYVDYPRHDEEKRIVEETTSAYAPEVEVVLTGEEIVYLQHAVREVPVGDHVLDYAVRLGRSSRPEDPIAPEFVRRWVAWGAGPRASQTLVLTAKTRAMLYGRPVPSIEDVQAMARSALRHRIITSFAAEADDITGDQVVESLLEAVPEP
ncbi:MAG: MoxR family ATPase [Armatimonadota bacterium]|nr:MoxR family ATPase [Armatimonadota bacterium]